MESEAEALARQVIGTTGIEAFGYEAIVYTEHLKKAIPKVAELLSTFLRRHDEARDKQAALWESDARNFKACWDAACHDVEKLQCEAAALREINAQSGQELLDFSQENAALRERVKLADQMAGAIEYEATSWVLSKLAAAYRASQGEPKP